MGFVMSIVHPEGSSVLGDYWIAQT